MTLQNIPGIMFKNEDGLIEYTVPREPIADLDTLPFPDYEAMGLPELLEHTPCSYIYDHFDYPRPYPILASRSCPFTCTFCFHTLGGKYRQRSIDNIMQEVRFAVEKYRINLFFFYDDLFSSNECRAIQFCKRFRDYVATVPYEIKFIVELRVDVITPSLLSALKLAGCDTVCLGLESFSQPVLDSMRKHITPQQIQDALELITAAGMTPVGNFIFGDTAETLETAEETLEFFRNRQDILHGVRVAFIIPFQGSKIYKDRCTRNVDEEMFAEYRARYGYDYHEPTNMTKLSDEDFDILKDRVFTAHYTQGTYATMFMQDEQLYCRCPVCGKINHYHTMTPPGRFGMANVGCRHCNARFEMIGEWFPLVQWAIRIFGFTGLYRAKKMLSGA